MMSLNCGFYFIFLCHREIFRTQREPEWMVDLKGNSFATTQTKDEEYFENTIKILARQRKEEEKTGYQHKF
jgi:hypothetical protein